jgi:hypothetical protein
MRRPLQLIVVRDRLRPYVGVADDPTPQRRLLPMESRLGSGNSSSVALARPVGVDAVRCCGRLATLRLWVPLSSRSHTTQELGG